MPQQSLSSKPFRITRPASADWEILARAYALMGRAKKLLQLGPPSSFLGDQRYEPFQLEDETERTPMVGQKMLTDRQVGDLIRECVEQRIVPPLCPYCQINMKWYRSKRAEQNPKVIENFFSRSSCSRTALVATWCRA